MKALPLIALFAAALTRFAAASPDDLTLRIAPERDLVYNGGSREVLVQIELEARRPDRGQRTPMNLAVVLDRSGSMEGAKLEKARQAAAAAVDQLGDDDIFSLVVYDNRAEVLVEPAQLGARRERENIKSRIHRIKSGGGTALHAGVTLGARQLRHYLDRERVNRVILLSDGLANVGPSSTSDLVALGRDLRRDGMSVSTVGLGDDYNEDLMTALAEASHANYYYVQDAEKLPEIFAKELGAARTIIARGVNIRITVPSGVRLKEIVGYPEIKCDGTAAEIRLPEVFGAEKRRFIARCTVDKAHNEPLEVAVAALRYDGSDGKAAPEQRQTTQVKFTDAEEKSTASLRPEVAKEVAILDNSMAKQQAVKLADEGRTKEAADLLRSQVAKNKALPAAAAAPRLAEENRKLDQSAAQIESQGSLSKSERKQIQWENFQDKYQKR